MLCVNPIDRPTINESISHSYEIWNNRIQYLKGHNIDLTPLLTMSIFAEEAEEWWKKSRGECLEYERSQSVRNR